MQLQRWTLCIAALALSAGCPLDITVTAHDDGLDEPATDDGGDGDGEDDGFGDGYEDDTSDGDDGEVDWDCYQAVFDQCVGGTDPGGAEAGTVELKKGKVEKCGDGCGDDDGAGSDDDEGYGDDTADGYDGGDDGDLYEECDRIAIDSCTLPEDDGDWCDTDPEPDCFTTVYEQCIADGGCEEDCVKLAEESCYEPPPEDDCFTLVFDDCLANGGSEDECLQYASDSCYGTTPPEDDCYNWTFDLCIADGGTEEDCSAQARESCDPGIPDEPDCFSAVFEDCLANGGSEDECKTLAEESCAGTDDPIVIDVPEKDA